MRSEKRVLQQAFRFEFDPNREQRVLLAKSVGCSRYVYNWGLAESQRAYELTGKRPKLGELKAALVELKKTDAPWLYEVSAHIELDHPAEPLAEARRKTWWFRFEVGLVLAPRIRTPAAPRRAWERDR